MHSTEVERFNEGEPDSNDVEYGIRLVSSIDGTDVIPNPAKAGETVTVTIPVDSLELGNTVEITVNSDNLNDIESIEYIDEAEEFISHTFIMDSSNVDIGVIVK